MDNDSTPMRHEEEEPRQVSVWSPEDAARFLSSAIKEAQRPLTDALQQRSVSPGIFALVIALLVAAAAISGWVLIDRLDKSDQAADAARTDRDVAIDKRHEALARHDAVAARLMSTQEQAERTKRELETENERLRTEAAGYKASDDELKRLRTDLNRYRRQNELLRTQISGLEMEKQALARQLSAVKALADPDNAEDLDTAISSPSGTSEMNDGDDYPLTEAIESTPRPEAPLPPEPRATPVAPTPEPPAPEPEADQAPVENHDAPEQPDQSLDNLPDDDNAGITGFTAEDDSTPVDESAEER